MKKIISCLIVIIIALSAPVNAQSKDAARHFNEGLEKMSKENIFLNIDDAIVDFKKAIELTPDYTKAHEALGIALLTKATPIFKKLKNEKLISRERIDLSFDLVILLNEALRSFETSYKYDKNNMNVVKKMLEIYSLLGMSEEYENMENLYNPKETEFKTFKI